MPHKILFNREKKKQKQSAPMTKLPPQMTKLPPPMTKLPPPMTKLPSGGGGEDSKGQKEKDVTVYEGKDVDKIGGGGEITLPKPKAENPFVPQPITDEEGEISGFRFRGKTFSGLSRDTALKNIQSLNKKYQPEAKLFEQREEERIQTQRQALIEQTEIPRSKQLEKKIGTFADLETGLPEESLIQIIAETPLFQSMIAKSSLEVIKEKGKGKHFIAMTKKMQEKGLRPEEITDDQVLQGILELELTERDLKILKSGKASVSKIALIVEGIPGVGDAAREFGGGALVPTVPSTRVDDLTNEIREIGNSVRDYRMAVAKTPSEAPEYLELLEEAQEKMLNSRSKVKLIMIQSGVLQNSPEQVRTMNSIIDRSLSRVGDARNAILGGESVEEARASLETQQPIEEFNP